ncbi:hypothetical protein P153DRAFT_399848 [Dothidotthia symphoricarpi CBS 119687]|uniref:Archaemetzincin-2 n=1 Tax=Dothidotthia symphoricarpi CBS 119687 TaxID=1392245 RepID=A0A6A6A3H6_9PLEO|nr:uncharacterized protein P153DRAFT_399848 [Dothidotthia symphoricarpi CBS 119687]KAF2125703.1 hypothetical protein P153DRAFT_399848 [Dothidotthia symphoricarpi CBS 119687]
MPLQLQNCQHEILQHDPSPFAALAGYDQPSQEKRAAAVMATGRVQKNRIVQTPLKTFPAPLVLPHDDLNYDPDCSPQSFKSWLHEEERNKILSGERRGTLYVARVPQIGKDVEFIRDWTKSSLEMSPENSQVTTSHSPAIEFFVDYLKAFYHDMDVAELPFRLQWTAWSNNTKRHASGKQNSIPKHLALRYNDRKTRIRVRSPPDGLFPAQMNLEDILDAATEMLPDDAYALLLLVDHDIYESEDDDFCCGRAYGGSRIAVVQTARYQPCLDVKENVDRAHIWPASHCKSFIDALCKVEDVEPQPPTAQQIKLSRDGPMRAAVDAASMTLTITSESTQEIQALWFSRLARTVSHELGHCFGMDHCVYYACNMQSTMGMKEDLRQPPYLCPVCEAKVGHAIAREWKNETELEKKTWIMERCKTLAEFCKKLENQEMGSTMWRGLHAWLEVRLECL